MAAPKPDQPNESVVPTEQVQVSDLPATPPRERPWTPEETARGWLAGGFLLIFGGTVLWACWSATGPHWSTAKELLQLLLPAETALLGGAVGFYFGSKK
jgi:hypothetical protein